MQLSYFKAVASVLWRALLIAFLLPAWGGVSAGTSSQGFIDPLDTPAITHAGLAQKPMMGSAMAGKRLVTVGMRGAIVVTDDAGLTWRQSIAPVQSDLTAVTFSSDLIGWAVGHDGVILNTINGGDSWMRQFDGRLAATQFVDHYKAQVAAGREDLQKLLKEVERNYQRGPVLPFLDVVFDNDQFGFAVGPFGMLAATEDGGKTWLPRLEQVENPELLSFYGARKIGGELYLAGERGMVYRFDRSRKLFVRIPTGYSGSLFGIVGNARLLVAYGLRGTVAVSHDAGLNWTLSVLPFPVAVVGVTLLDDDRLVLATLNGMLWEGRADGRGFKPLPNNRAVPATSVLAVATDKVLVTGLAGVFIQSVASGVRQ